MRVDAQPGPGPGEPDEPVQAADGQPPSYAQPQVGQVRAGLLSAPGEVLLQRPGGRYADHHRPDLGAFPGDQDPPGPQVIQADVGHLQAGQLGDPQPGVQGDGDDGLLAGTVAGFQQPADLLAVQVRDPGGGLRAADGDLPGDVRDALVLGQVLVQRPDSPVDGRLGRG